MRGETGDLSAEMLNIGVVVGAVLHEGAGRNRYGLIGDHLPQRDV